MEKYKIFEYLIILLATIIISYMLSIGTVRAEHEYLTLENEIIRLSKEYAISEKNQKVIRKIIQCESGNDPMAFNYNKNKNGKVWSTDLGYFQINDYFHEEEMEKLGLKIGNQWDNLEYGFLLISKQGYKPWSASSRCWQESDRQVAMKTFDK